MNSIIILMALVALKCGIFCYCFAIPFASSAVIPSSIAMNLQDASNSVHLSRSLKILPEKLLIAYANWNECDEKIIEAAKNGANVIMWFSINLATNPVTGEPTITNGPNWDCVANITYQLREVLKLPTIHMISVGGWNAPHPATSNPVEEVYSHWKEWNTKIIARPEFGFYGFDGIDWDIEGNDDFSSPSNKFSLPCLDLMGHFSQLAKRDGYLVSMAPCESYVDPTGNWGKESPRFDLYVNHTYPEWNELVPNFYYHGHNTYAYILHKFGKTDVDQHLPDNSATIDGETKVDTFDWVSVQLYEGYSHAEYNISILAQSPADYLTQYVNMLASGWHITPGDHELDDLNPSTTFNQPRQQLLPNFFVQLPLNRLVIGLGNGWAFNTGKFLFLSKDAIHESYKRLQSANLLPRGFMYWDIADEGMLVDGKPFFMSKVLNEVMHTRP